MDRWFAVMGGIMGALGVGLGAFAAHGLKARVTPDLLAVFETGARYHLTHALALVAVAWAASRWQHAAIHAAGWLFFAGILIFSGSLYALVLTGVRGLGAITPIGGLCMIAGWVCLAWGAARG